MWHFLTLSILPIFEETHTGDLIKICRSLWLCEDALMWAGEREWIFYLLGIWWFYFIGTYNRVSLQRRKGMLLWFKAECNAPLLQSLRGWDKAEFTFFPWPTKARIDSSITFQIIFLLIIVKDVVDNTEQQILITSCMWGLEIPVTQ